MEYLQEEQNFPGFIHILYTGGNDAEQKASCLFHSFHRPFCYYEYLYMYYNISTVLKRG